MNGLFFRSCSKKARTVAGIVALALSLPAPAVQGAKPPAADAPTAYTLEFTPRNVQRTLDDFLKFIQATAPATDGIRAQYLAAELYLQRGEFRRAAEIFQKLAAVTFDDKYFNVSVLEKLADCYFRQGLFQQAADSYMTVRNSNVKAILPEALLGLSVSALALGNREEAYLRIQELLAFHPAYANHVPLILPIGLVHWENGKFQEALDLFQRDPDNPASLYFAGLCQRSLDKPVDAMGTFKKVVQNHRKTVWGTRAKFELAETFYQKKDYPLASRTFDQIYRGERDDAWETLALYRLACSDMHMRRFKDAETKLWPLQKKKKDHRLHPNVNYLLTESLAEQNKIEKMVPLLKAEIKGKGRTPDNIYRLIWSLAAIGDYAEVIRQSNEFLSTSWDMELTPKTLVAQGYAYDKLGRTPESAASYQLVAENFSNTPYAARALQLTAMTYFRSKQHGLIVTQVNNQWNAVPLEIRQKNPETLFWIAEAHLQLENGAEAREHYKKFLDFAPPDHPLGTQALMGEAVSYAVDKDFPTAILTLQKTLQSAQEKGNKPLMAASMLEMGNVFFNAKDYENAASSYRSFREVDPKHAQAAFSLYQEGLALHRAEYYSDAIAAWDKLVKTHPKAPQASEALFRKAKTLFDTGNYPGAVKDYEKLIGNYPKSEFAKDARLQIGQCFYNAGDFAKAIVHYTDFLNRFPDDPLAPSVLQLLQTSYYQAKKTPDEIEKLTRNQPKSAILADIYWEEGAKLYNEKSYDKAREYFQKILSEFPSSSLAPQAAFYRAESLYLQEKYFESIPAYENFIRYYPEDAQRSLAMFHLSVGLFNQKEYAESAKAFGDFAAQFPDDPMAKNANLNVAVCYAKAQDVNNAVAAYERYIALYPDGEDVGATYLQMGQLLEKFGQEARAADVYKRVPKNLPEYAEALFNAGRCYRALNQLAGEQQAYEDLRLFAPKNDAYRTAGLLQLAEIHLTKNETAKAAEIYRDVVANAADDQSRAMAEERLKTLGP
ncbi:MAG TPA: tetratricopeptide repeat protein [Elusimicrobiota bacterium]|nr:tetratricopeptide repeat protein [Elusimicrobiota bacterium]